MLVGNVIKFHGWHDCVTVYYMLQNKFQNYNILRVEYHILGFYWSIKYAFEQNSYEKKTELPILIFCHFNLTWIFSSISIIFVILLYLNLAGWCIHSAKIILYPLLSYLLWRPVSHAPETVTICNIVFLHQLYSLYLIINGLKRCLCTLNLNN